MIVLRHVSKSYATPAGEFVALRDIDLEIGAGEMVAVSGRSGSGKSTLLNMAGGIDQPSSGSVIVYGTDIAELNESQLAGWRARTIGFVFQFFQLMPTLTAAENVILPMDFRRAIPPPERRNRAMALLDKFGVVDQAGKLPAALSGGQQQRVAIARALANDPPVILADEPTGNLDSETGDSIFRIFGELATQGKSVVVVTHERNLEGRIDRTVHLADGVVLA
jgi:putative ABC transport system ATP-binding protein